VRATRARARAGAGSAVWRLAKPWSQPRQRGERGCYSSCGNMACRYAAHGWRRMTAAGRPECAARHAGGQVAAWARRRTVALRVAVVRLRRGLLHAQARSGAGLTRARPHWGGARAERAGAPRAAVVQIRVGVQHAWTSLVDAATNFRMNHPSCIVNIEDFSLKHETSIGSACFNNLRRSTKASIAAARRLCLSLFRAVPFHTARGSGTFRQYLFLSQHVKASTRSASR
jgi:hypothetical protein